MATASTILFSRSSRATIHQSRFPCSPQRISTPQVSCSHHPDHAETHRIIADNIHRSAMYSGRIQSRGPRYCPSIEDKIVRFADRDSHQIFLEPEGLTTRPSIPTGFDLAAGRRAGRVPPHDAGA
jgi:glucose-inhibited division protein A